MSKKIGTKVGTETQDIEIIRVEMNDVWECEAPKEGTYGYYKAVLSMLSYPLIANCKIVKQKDGSHRVFFPVGLEIPKEIKKARIRSCIYSLADF